MTRGRTTDSAGRAWARRVVVPLLLFPATMSLQGCGEGDATRPSSSPAAASPSADSAAGAPLPTEERAATTGATRPATAPAPSKDPSTVPSRALLAALRSLPAVADRGAGEAWLQRAAGEPVLLSRVEAAGHRARFRLRVPVDRREDSQASPRRYGVIVDAWVDASGTPGRIEGVGEEDPEFLALFGD